MLIIDVVITQNMNNQYNDTILKNQHSCTHNKIRTQNQKTLGRYLQQTKTNNTLQLIVFEWWLFLGGSQPYNTKLV